MRPPPPPVRTSAPPAADAAALAAELEQTKRVLATKLADLRGFQTERETLLARIAERDARIQRLEAGSTTDVPRLRTQIGDLEAELSVAKAEASRAAQLDAELSALRAHSRRLDASLSELEARVRELDAALELERGKLAERDARVRALEAEAESLAWAPALADDLTRIKGIGPKFRDALAAAGVKSYSQIAGWGEAEIAEIAAKLRIQPNRIQREGWVEAAKALASQGQRVG